MDRLSTMWRTASSWCVSLWRIATIWYVSLPFIVAIGVAIGYFVFFEVYPGKPKIGIIDIPFTVLDDDSAFEIVAFLDFVRRNGDIKAAVIRLNSPGSTGHAGDLIYEETRKLREEKPVVIVMGDFGTSGAYMWSLGANYAYAKPATILGHVGVRFFLPALIPEPPAETGRGSTIITGPFKDELLSRSQAFEFVDQAKRAFLRLVIAERGEKLRISEGELAQARVYFGIEAVRLGLVDAIGGDTEAIEKAASLAGISRYDLVDVNTEVRRILTQKQARILDPLLPFFETAPRQSSVADLLALLRSTGDSFGLLDGEITMDAFRRFFPPSDPEVAELKRNLPRIDYLYDGPTP